jgi:hypothetical protein
MLVVQRYINTSTKPIYTSEVVNFNGFKFMNYEDKLKTTRFSPSSIKDALMTKWKIIEVVPLTLP